MEKKYEKKYHDLESNHWWFVSRRNYIISLLKTAYKESKILDIGCSLGILLKNLKRKGFLSKNLFGVDINERAIHNSREKGLQNTFVMDAQKITLKEKFDIIISSDCLEHLKEDKKSNKELGQFAET